MKDVDIDKQQIKAVISKIAHVKDTDLATDPQSLLILLGTYMKEFAPGGFVSAVLYVRYCTITSRRSKQR